MSVIYFYPWRVFCFVNEDNENVIRRWLDQERIPLAQRNALQAQIDLIERVGPECVPGAIVPVAGEFLEMKAGRKGEMKLGPVLCYGPFADTELTLLAGAPIQSGILKARDILKVAEHNLRILKGNPKRRRHEPIT